jgi:hypothetical protein
MPKAASPVRLQQELMQAAALTGKRFHRSTAEQIEYWASLGQRVAAVLDPDVLLSIQAGLARVRVEPVVGRTLDPEAVFQGLEQQRRTSTLSGAVSSGRIRYQASSTHPGLLERLDPEGTITLGRFEQGRFVPMSGSQE